MENRIFIKDFQIELNRAAVFKMLDCYEDSPVYEEVCEAFMKWQPWLYANVHPKAVLAWEPDGKVPLQPPAEAAGVKVSVQPGTSAETKAPAQPDGKVPPQPVTTAGSQAPAQPDGLLYLLMTLGPEVESEVTGCFETGDYLEGMLLDAMADDYLFQMEARVQESLRIFCGDIGRGILRRMEAPGDIPMEFHSHILEVCGVAGEWKMSLSTGFMFSPVKTSCVVFELTKDRALFRAQHDCSHCPAVNCKLRKAAIE